MHVKAAKHLSKSGRRSLSGAETSRAIVVQRHAALAPFQVRSFRFQWPADLCTSWAFEMEMLILGWYVLVETGSVKLLVLFGALQFVGSLFSPLFGVAGDRIGHRQLLLMTRSIYAMLALLLMLLSFTGNLSAVAVLVISGLAGVLRPSDMVMRHALIAQTLPPAQLLGALGISRTTSDSARIAGALAGAGAVAAFGMTIAYAVVTVLYVVSALLSAGVAGRSAAQSAVRTVATPATPVQDLRLAFSYVWARPVLLGAMGMAFLANLLAFPFFLGLLPYVAKDIYLIGQTGLSTLAASFSAGGLAGSLLLSANLWHFRAARMMLVAGLAWFAVVVLFSQVTEMRVGIVLLMLAGFAQNLCLTPLAGVMLRGSEEAVRGRVMGMRMLAIWGLPFGLLLAGPLIEHFGFANVGATYGLLGIALTLAIGSRWRADLWRPDSPANSAAQP